MAGHSSDASRLEASNKRNDHGLQGYVAEAKDFNRYLSVTRSIHAVLGEAVIFRYHRDKPCQHATS